MDTDRLTNLLRDHARLNQIIGDPTGPLHNRMAANGSSAAVEQEILALAGQAAAERLTPEQAIVLQAAREYYWHNDEDVDFHNDLMDAVVEMGPGQP